MTRPLKFRVPAPKPPPARAKPPTAAQWLRAYRALAAHAATALRPDQPPPLSPAKLAPGSYAVRAASGYYWAGAAYSASEARYRALAAYLAQRGHAAPPLDPETSGEAPDPIATRAHAPLIHEGSGRHIIYAANGPRIGYIDRSPARPGHWRVVIHNTPRGTFPTLAHAKALALHLAQTQPKDPGP